MDGEFRKQYSIKNIRLFGKTSAVTVTVLPILGGMEMISYGPFWETLKNSTETTYTLINKYHISSAIIDKLRKNKPMTTTTLNELCRILNCQLQDIAQYIPSDKDQPL